MFFFKRIDKLFLIINIAVLRKLLFLQILKDEAITMAKTFLSMITVNVIAQSKKND